MIEIVVLGAAGGYLIFMVFAAGLCAAAKRGDRVAQRALRDAGIYPAGRRRLP